MALHPFQSFRRHQRKLLAAVTIMCMFIFILQFGKGDVLDRMMTLFGAGRKEVPVTTASGDPVKVYGKKVTELELETLRARRKLANDIVTRMFENAIGTTLGEMEKPKGLDEFDKVDQAMIQRVLSQMAMRQPPEQRRAQASSDHGFLERMRQNLLE